MVEKLCPSPSCNAARPPQIALTDGEFDFIKGQGSQIDGALKCSYCGCVHEYDGLIKGYLDGGMGLPRWIPV